MYLRIRPGAPISVHEPDDCGRLHVTAASDAEADTALRAAALGRLAGPGEVWLDLAALRALTEAEATAADWPDRWAKMVGYARSKGWADTGGREVRAHIEG